MSTVPHLLYVRLIGDVAHAKIDNEIVNALRYIPPIVTGVVLKVPCWQMAPNAAEYWNVKRAIRLLGCLGIPFYWTRDLWVSWPGKIVDAPPAWAGSEYQPAFYAAAIRQVQGEAEALGAAGCGLDTEPYGESLQNYFKDGLGEWPMRGIRHAIEQATQMYSGQVDLVFPAGHFRDDWFAHPMSLLGTEGIRTYTYYAPSAEALSEQNREPNPLSGYTTLGNPYWGQHVGQPGDKQMSMNLVTPAQLEAIDWDEIRAAYPSVKGCLIYIGHSSFAYMLEHWRELAGGA